MKTATYIRSGVLLWIAIALIAILLVLNAVSGSLGEEGESLVQNYSRDPLVLAAIGAILTFLFIERWRRLESDLSSVNKSQVETLRNIREEAGEIIKSKVESSIRRAQAVESRLGTLLDEHPWVGSITENNLIPDVPSCRVVLMTAQALRDRGDEALMYEYLYGWIISTKEQQQLAGVLDDFLDLADFCSVDLQDEYLSLMIIEKAYKSSGAKDMVLPLYLIRLVRHGYREIADRVAGELEMRWSSDIRYKIYRIYRKISIDRRSALASSAYSSLALFYSSSGEGTKADSYLERAFAKAGNVTQRAHVELIRAETMIHSCDYEGAIDHLDRISEKVKISNIGVQMADFERVKLIASGGSLYHSSDIPSGNIDYGWTGVSVEKEQGDVQIDSSVMEKPVVSVVPGPSLGLTADKSAGLPSRDR